MVSGNKMLPGSTLPLAEKCGAEKSNLGDFSAPHFSAVSSAATLSRLILKEHK
jgi:hypothetical protein